jgi:hypothetical protein
LAVPPDLGASVRRREGPARRAVRHVWNAALSLLLGGMIGVIGHQFAADAIARLFEAGMATADATRALFWLVGAGAAGVLFFSYYLDDTSR